MGSLAMIHAVSSWWSELTMAKQIFFGIGLAAGFAVLIFAVLTVAGLDAHHDFDHPDADGALGLFSVKPMIGFFLCFGWIGGWMIDVTRSVALASLIGLAAGVATMFAIAGLLRAIYSMRSDGTIRTADAVGRVATVYVTIEPARASGGQVIVGMDGRTITLGALYPGPDRLPSDTKVRITALLDPHTVEVEKL